MASFAEWTEKEKKKKKKQAKGASFTEYTKQVLGKDDIEAPLSEREDDDIAPVVTTKKEDDSLWDRAFPGGVLNTLGDMFDDWKGDLKDAWHKTQTIEGYSEETKKMSESGEKDLSGLLSTNFNAGIGSFNKSITATADLILGKPLQAIGWENNPISKAADYYSDVYDTYQERIGVLEKNAGDGKFVRIGGDIVEGVAGAIPNALLALMTAGGSAVTTSTTLSNTAAYNMGGVLTRAGLKTSAMMKNPQYWLSFAQTAGTDYEEAKAKGASDEVAAIGATLTSLIKAGFEIGLDGGSGIQGLPAEIADGDGSKILAWVMSSLEEGNEEVVQGVVDRTVANVLYGSEEKIFDGGVMAKEFGMGTAVGGVIGGGQIGVQGAVNAANNAIVNAEARKLTANEQAVVDKVVEDRIAEAEQDGTKLTNAEKKKIHNAVFEEMERGEIPTDTIEEVLGGDAYKAHTDTLAREKALQEEYDTLYKMKNGEKSDEQIDRQADLKKQLDEIKQTFNRNQLSDTVYGMVQNDRLAESYYEVERKGQDFVADFSKYEKAKHKDAARKTLENAIKAGANNTRPVRNFVEWVARTSGDTGLSYDFKSGDQIKADFIERQTKLIAEMEKIPEARRTEAQAKKLASMKDLLAKVENGDTIVNGDITENGIVLNLDSAKPLNRVVGHEIMHSLEQAKHNGKLRDALFAFAKTKGIDIDGKIAEYAAIYEGVENANPEAELVSDLVGDFLFSDADFINHLSANHRNVFQYVYDKIKYLCKVATAGSKEARQLEKVKKAFEDAYRSGGKAQSGTNYAISNVGGRHMPVIDIKNDTRDIGAAEAYLETLVDTENVFSTILYDAQPVYIGNDLPSEYKGSEYTFGMNSSLRKVKMQAATNLDEMLLLASNGEWVKNKKDKHNKDAKNGWYRYDTEFAVPVMRYKDFDHYTVYGATLLIRNDADGKSYLYDMVDVKEKQKVFNSPTSGEAVFESRPSADDNVAQPDEKVKHDYSLTDTTYMDAVNRGDTETAQKMVFEVAKEAGYTVRAYHGTRRGDRVGNVFLPERATSGPMAFFTDSKEIAEHYARDKADTSLAYDEEYEDYYSQFRVNQNGKSVKVQDLWRSLPFAEKQRIKEAGKHITWDEDMVNIVWDDDATNGLGNWDAYTLNLHKGNAIEALIDSWLESGELYGNEGDFIQVLEMAGIKGVEYRDPDARHDKVYDTLLKIQKPFDTATVDDGFADGFEAWYSQQPDGKYDRDTANADMWDKNSQTAETFLDRLREDIADGTTRAWTSIPDSVTDYLKHLGYDGIRDTGGKNGGEIHTVWIPFESAQVKSAEPITYDDNGNVIPLSERFNPQENDIRHSLSNNNLFAPIGKADIYGKDFATPARDLKLETAPVQETVADNATVEETAEVAPELVTEMFPDDLAPVADDPERFDSLTDEDAPPERVIEQEEVGNQIPLPKSAVSWIAKTAREELGLSNNQMADLHNLIEDYSMQEFPSREQLFKDIKDMFGIVVEADEDSEIKDVKRHLRNQRLYVSDAIKGDIPDYGDWRRAYFGSLRFSRQGLPVDSAYQELSGLYPNFFPNAITNPTDQLLQMAAVSKYEAKTEREWDIDDDTLWDVTDDIIESINDYQQNQLDKTRERESRDAFDSLVKSGEDYAPVVLEDAVTPTAQPVAEDTARPEAKTENKPIKTVKERLAEKLANTQAELASNQRLREQARADYEQEIARLQAEYNAKANKNTIAGNDLLRRIERTKRLMGNVDADYAKRISDLEAKVTKTAEEVRSGESATEQGAMRRELHASIVDRIRSAFNAKGFDLDTVLRKAKNLSTLATVDNIPQRVMEKSLGYKAGQVLADMTVNQVAQNETEGIKWLNSFTDRKSGLLAQLSEQYNIKPGSKESAAAQMYAEGFYVDDNNNIVQYGNAELAADFPDAKVRANIRGLAGDKRIRQIYDETLSMINESRARNAYPEIKRLDNYFLHFRAMNDTFSRLGLPFNPNDIKAKDLPTDLNGVTADLKPGQPFFASAMHRKGKRTSFDLLGGLEQYLTAAKGQIFHIDDIQTLRALRNYIADTYGQANGLEGLDALTEEEAQDRIEKVYGAHLSTFAKFLNEEANVLAGKTALIDRGLEGIIGRRGITFLDTLNKQVGSNMVGYNISSSLTNFLPVVQTFAKTNKADFVRAFAQTVGNKVNTIFGRSDGFAEQSPVVIRRKGADRFSRTAWQKMADPGYALMGAVDSVSTELIARTKYNELIRNGMDSQQAHIETDKWVSRLMGDRSLGQMPQIYNSKMLGLVTKFQLEVRNQLDSQFYDTIQETKVSNERIENGLARNARIAAKVTSTFVQLAVAQHLFGTAFESVAGYNPAFDIIEVLMTAFGFDDDEDSEDTALDNVEQGFLALLEDLPYTSVITDGGRIPVSAALPIGELVKGQDEWGNEKSRWETLGEVAPYYALPTGYGQIKKTVQGLSMFSDDHPIAGSYTDSGNLRFPVEDNLANRVQAGLFGQWASENARDYFDNDRAPLKEKQIQEFVDVDLPIRDYWEYREGLSGKDKLAEKADYIAGLDLPISKKNILINNQTDRKEPIDLTGYEDYGNFEEFDFAKRFPEKYAVLQDQGISVSDYKKNIEETAFIYTDDYSKIADDPGQYALSKVVSDDLSVYMGYKSEISSFEADKDSSGKSISGSKKEKVLDYINGLNLDYGQKIILYRSYYSSKEDRRAYNSDIVDYLNSRDDISYKDMETILKELGFEVDSNGNIYWD